MGVDGSLGDGQVPRLTKIASIALRYEKYVVSRRKSEKVLSIRDVYPLHSGREMPSRCLSWTSPMSRTVTFMGKNQQSPVENIYRQYV